MARKNRKKRRLSGFMIPVPFAGLVVLLAVSALAYIWLGSRCEALGRDLKGLEMEREGLKEKLMIEEYKWIRMKSPQELERALDRHKIIMTWPQSEQVIHVTDVNLLEGPSPAENNDALQFARLERMIMNE